MEPRWRTLLVGILASGLAIWVGTALAQEEHLVAALSAGACLWLVLAWTRGPLAEAWLLGFLVFGYVIGNRGFAQLAPIAGLPLFFSELGLGVAVALVLLRGALQRTVPVKRDWLNSLLILWLVLGIGRLPWDIRAFGFLALRDFALIYYLLYFFVAQAIAQHPASRALVGQAFLVTFTCLPLTGLLAVLFPDFFRANFLVEGVPLIFYKGDLLATFLFTGFIVTLPATRIPLQKCWWRWLAAVMSLVLGLELLSRSSLLGLLVAMGWLGFSGRWRAARVFAAVCAGGLLAVTLYSLLQKKDFMQTRAYAVYESAASIFDYSGTGRYQSEDTSNKGDNNRFRLIWWKNVAEETVTTSPITGLGFGADLARGFLAEYYPTGDPDFSARSPHNVFVTTLGRMGLAGVVVLISIYWVQARITARVAREARADPARDGAMTLQAAVWVVMVSSCLGVVLEGPMGAIPFWIMLGLAHYLANHPDPGPGVRRVPIAPLPAAGAGV